MFLIWIRLKSMCDAVVFPKFKKCKKLQNETNLRSLKSDIGSLNIVPRVLITTELKLV